MSYEGYDVMYCINGHNCMEIQDYEKKSCPICGETEFVFDSVDQTNGCCCHKYPDGKKCPAHESVTKIVGYKGIECEHCKGTGIRTINCKWDLAPCEDCIGKSCDKCKGTGRIPKVAEKIQAHCNICYGTGIFQEPEFDVSHLIEKKKKYEQRYKEFEEQHYMRVTKRQMRDKGLLPMFRQDLTEMGFSIEVIDGDLGDDEPICISKALATKYGLTKSDEVKNGQ